MLSDRVMCVAVSGWYKSFEIKCKGHPLSELSRDIVAGEEVMGLKSVALICLVAVYAINCITLKCDGILFGSIVGAICAICGVAWQKSRQEADTGIEALENTIKPI